MEWTKRPDKKFYQNKRTNLVAWYVDDCNEAKTIREDYVSYMENYIKVDIYGKCGNQECQPQKVRVSYNVIIFKDCLEFRHCIFSTGTILHSVVSF